MTQTALCSDIQWKNTGTCPSLLLSLPLQRKRWSPLLSKINHPLCPGSDFLSGDNDISCFLLFLSSSFLLASFIGLQKYFGGLLTKIKRKQKLLTKTKRKQKLFWNSAFSSSFSLRKVIFFFSLVAVMCLYFTHYPTCSDLAFVLPFH